MNTITGSGYDDTAVVQQAINDLRTNGGKIQLIGELNISQLNATRLLKGMTFEGEGAFCTRIKPFADVNAVIDYSGSFGVRFRDLQVGDVAQTCTPATAFLGLQTKIPVGNINGFDNVFVTGKYVVATVYQFGMASAASYGLHVWNYKTGGKALYLGSDNYNNMSSPFLPTDPADPYSRAEGGNHPCSDLDFFRLEAHGYVDAQAPDHDIKAIHIRGGMKIGFHGGNVSGSANEQITLDADCTGRPCETLAFYNTEFYSENGVAPKYIFRANAPVLGLLMDFCPEKFGPGYLGSVEGVNLVTPFVKR